MFKSYLFVKKNRFRKKVTVYKLFLSISLDLTSLFYVAVLFGYGLFAFYRVGEMPLFVKQAIVLLENVLENNHYLMSIALFIPIFFISKSFQRPGVIFSSAEFLLSLLPHSRKRLWLYSYAEKILKILLSLLIIATATFALTAVTYMKLIFIVVTILLITIIMTFIQWKLYQLHIVWRMITLMMASSLGTLFVIWQNPVILYIYSTFMLLTFSLSLRYLFTAVDWTRVIAASDFEIWNMQFISQATKVKFKKDEQASLWYRQKEWKQEFPYKKIIAYNRLWYIYGEKQIGIIFQVTGALFVLLVVVSYFSSLYYVIFTAIAIHIQTTFLVSLFKDRLYTGLVNILPWDIRKFKGSFMNWAILMNVPLIIPIGYYAVFHFDKLFIVYLIYIMIVFYYLLNNKLQSYLHELAKSEVYTEVYDFIGYGLLLILIFSKAFPYLLIIGFLVLCIIYLMSAKKEKT